VCVCIQYLSAWGYVHPAVARKPFFRVFPTISGVRVRNRWRIVLSTKIETAEGPPSPGERKTIWKRKNEGRRTNRLFRKTTLRNQRVYPICPIGVQSVNEKTRNYEVPVNVASYPFRIFV